MTKTMRFAFGAALGVLLLAGAPSSAHAQQDVGGTIISSLEFEQTDVREALRALFKNVGVSYTIAPEVQGTITVSLKNVPFETALQNITRQVDATYRIEGGVYQIVRREDPGTVTSGGQTDLAPITSNKVRRRIKIRYATQVKARPPHFALFGNQLKDFLYVEDVAAATRAGLPPAPAWYAG